MAKIAHLMPKLVSPVNLVISLKQLKRVLKEIV